MNNIRYVRLHNFMLTMNIHNDEIFIQCFPYFFLFFRKKKKINRIVEIIDSRYLQINQTKRCLKKIFEKLVNNRV